ncbi:hypothetical protein [Nocardioides sp. GXQ0305]|uniref:hypothetical protein n=1 Tax=Nocardioides sp. GXQ0305 TaxID=3423912 RepID=UPI003D7D85EE
MLLVPTTGGDDDLTAPRHALVLTAPDPAARARAEQLGLPVVVSPELGTAEPDEVPEDRAHRLDAAVRGHAAVDRYRDLVVVADADTLRGVAAGLCALPEAPTRWSEQGVVTIGLPRGSRPVRLVPVLVGGGVAALVTLVSLAWWHPLVVPAAVAGVGLVLLPWAGSRHAGRTLLAVAGLAAVLVFVLVAGATRFPVE